MSDGRGFDRTALAAWRGPLVIEAADGSRLELTRPLREPPEPDAFVEDTKRQAVASVREQVAAQFGWLLSETVLLDNEGVALADGDHSLLGWCSSLTACRKRPGRAISGSADGNLVYWDLDSGDVLQILSGHVGAVQCVVADFAFGRVVSGGSDSQMRVWDLKRGITMSTLKGHVQTVTCLAADLPAEELLSGSADGTARAWELSSGRCSHVYRCHDGGAIRCIAVDFPTKQALFGCDDGAIRSWDLASHQRLHVVQVNNDRPVRCLAADFYSMRLITASTDIEMALWDLSSWQRLASFRGHEGVSTCVAADLGPAKRAISGGDDGALVCWDLSLADGPRCLGPVHPSFGGEAAVVHCVVADFSVGRALSGTEGAKVQYWDLASGDCIGTFLGHGSRIRCLAAQFPD